MTTPKLVLIDIWSLFENKYWMKQPGNCKGNFAFSNVGFHIVEWLFLVLKEQPVEEWKRVMVHAWAQ